MNQQFKDLTSKKIALEAEASKYDYAIKALQELCDHKWVFDYKDRHRGDEHYTCSECGKEKKE